MLTPHVALVSQSEFVDRALLMRISAAVQKQCTRDVARHWQISATVDPYDRLSDVPSDYWPIVVRDDIGFPGVRGIHWARDKQPFALVQSSLDADRVSHAISHEAVEMVVDPPGNRLVAGTSPVPQQGRVNFLVEPCDPSQGPDFAYRVNGVLVCDFCTPNYFDPMGAPGIAYSFCGHVTRPREVLLGGYLSWIDPATDHLWQALNFTGSVEMHDRGPYNPNMPIRFQTDRAVELQEWKPASRRSARGIRWKGDQTFEKRAQALEAHIKRVIRKASWMAPSPKSDAVRLGKRGSQHPPTKASR